MTQRLDHEPSHFRMLDSIGILGKKYRTEVKTHERGGMGEIWIAYDPVLSKKVAIKTGIPSAEFNGFSVTREAQVHIATNNRFIIPLYDLVKIDEGVGIVMQYVDPKRAHLLDEYLYGKELSKADLLTIVSQLSQFIDSYAREGHFHRDLKLNNVFFYPDSHDRFIQVIDLGLSGDARSDFGVRKQDESVGTPSYMSPQRLSAHESKLTDEVYALGTMIYNLLMRTMPGNDEDIDEMFRFSLSEKNFAKEMEKSVSLLNWNVPPRGIASVLERAMHPDEKARYPDGASLFQALNSALANEQAGTMRQ